MRVLLAENNQSNSLVARSILEREGHVVTIVPNGVEAIGRARVEPFDIILLDIVMPVMDGLESVQYLRPPLSKMLVSVRPYVFALTAYDRPDDIAAYQQAGFDGVIAKPLRKGDLHASFSRVKNGDGPTLTPTLTGIAANSPDAASRPLLDEAIIRDGAGLADDVTRERIWRSYRQGLSVALREISRCLPGCLNRDVHDTERLQAALHSLRSASLTVGMDRAPYLASELRGAPIEDLTTGVAKLLHAVRDSLPQLEQALLDISAESVATR